MKLILVLGCSLVLLLQTAGAMPQGQTAAKAGTSSLNGAINHGGKIETKYDGFSHETVMRLRKMPVTCNGFKDNFKNACLSIEVALHCPGAQLNYVGSVTIQIVFDNKDWGHLHPWDQRDLSVVTDAETLRFGRMVLVTRPGTGNWETKVETLEATIPYGAFKKMVQSQAVAVQVGLDSVELTEKNLAAIRDLNGRVLTTTQ
jgi:hypothetical protein